MTAAVFRPLMTAAAICPLAAACGDPSADEHRGAGRAILTGGTRVTS
jgi:hypothetical protein